MSEIESEIKGYILEEFLPGEDPANLATDTPLLSTRILELAGDSQAGRIFGR